MKVNLVMNYPPVLIVCGWLFFSIGCAGTPIVELYEERDYEALAVIEQLEYARDFKPAVFSAMLVHENAHVRSRAALALGRIQAPESLNILTSAIAEESAKGTLLEMVFALGQLGSERAVPSLETLARSKSAKIRAKVAEAFGKLGAATRGAANQKAANQIAVQGSEIASALGEKELLAIADRWILTLLRDPEPIVRQQAALAVWRFESEQGLAEIKQRISDEKNAAVRWRMVYSLARIQREDTCESLLPMLEDPHPWVRSFAAMGMGRPAYPAAIDALLQLLTSTSSSWHAKVMAANSLAAIRGSAIANQEQRDRARDGLLQCLMVETNSHVRIRLIAAIGASGGLIEAKLLGELLGQAEVQGYEPAVLAGLGKLGQADSVPLIRDHLADSNPTVRAAALRALSNFGNEQLESILNLKKDPDVRVRSAMVEALASLSTAERWDFIWPLCEDPDLAVRAIAVQTIIDEKPDHWIKKLAQTYHRSSEAQYWETRVNILGALANYNEYVEPLAKQALSDEMATVRWKAAEILQQPAEKPPFVSHYPRIEINDVFGQEKPLLIIETVKGRITVELFLREAPIHVSNIIGLARSKFYDGLTFHRIVSGFVVQGGDPRGDGWGDAGYFLPDELNARPYLRGTLGMPKAGKDTGGCQIFISHLPTPHLDGRYTVFGRVVLGMEVVDQLQVDDRIISVRVDENQFRTTR